MNHKRLYYFLDPFQNLLQLCNTLQNSLTANKMHYLLEALLQMISFDITLISFNSGMQLYEGVWLQVIQSNQEYNFDSNGNTAVT